MKTLDQIKKKQTARVIKVNGDGALKRRIMDMGLTRGASVTVCKLAPLGDPIELIVRGYSLTLRKADARLIEVEDISDCGSGGCGNCDMCKGCK